MRKPTTPRLEFDREAKHYDRTARASMPGYSDLHWMLSRGIPFLPTRAFRVLELGVGTGTLTELLLSEYPHAHVTGIDLSPKMIARARTKLKRYRDRVDLVHGPLEAFREGEYDAVVSALAIHHLADREKWRLFRRIHRSLPSGGYFGDGDDHLPEDPVFDTRFSQIAGSPTRGSRGGGSWNSPQAVWHEHERFDHPCTLSSETVRLGRAGFAHVGVPWRFFGQAVVWAYK
ncbi:MAG: class I SAM-dependent methyltransferase [Thermoplasmata archaeon]